MVCVVVTLLSFQIYPSLCLSISTITDTHKHESLVERESIV